MSATKEKSARRSRDKKARHVEWALFLNNHVSHLASTTIIGFSYWLISKATPIILPHDLTNYAEYTFTTTMISLAFGILLYMGVGYALRSWTVWAMEPSEEFVEWMEGRKHRGGKDKDEG
ncbi:hypothetical protein LTR17_017778 [Elasticomyces elasticus]|nr:hypothetical protein LTR17_017778 [Elasticomyces elasticus]